MCLISPHPTILRRTVVARNVVIRTSAPIKWPASRVLLTTFSLQTAGSRGTHRARGERRRGVCLILKSILIGTRTVKPTLSKPLIQVVRFTSSYLFTALVRRTKVYPRAGLSCVNVGIVSILFNRPSSPIFLWTIITTGRVIPRKIIECTIIIPACCRDGTAVIHRAL